jgi:hypothetical protein
VRPAIRFGGERAAHVRTAPLLDQHGADIRRALAAAPAWPASLTVPSTPRRNTP